MNEQGGHKVELYIYDLSAGLCQQLSELILGKKFDGIWHTSIVVFNKEYYFGSTGIVYCKPGTTNLGPPLEIINLGNTDVTEDLLEEYIEGLKESVFAVGTYDLLNHNCNTFSNELAQFLVGKTIPTHILQLPSEITQSLLESSYSQIANLLSESITSNRRTSPDFDELNNDIDAARQRSALLEQKRNKIQAKLEKHEKKKKKKRSKNNPENNTADNPVANHSQSHRLRHRKMSDNVNGEACQNGSGKSASEIAAEIEEQDKKEREERRRQTEPPVVFPNVVNLQEEFDKVIDLVDGNVTPEEMQFFEELHQYLLEDEGSWAIGDGFLTFVGKLLSDQKFPPELRVRLLNVLAVAALKEDIILVLHQDRREHVFMNYAHNFDRLPVDEQKSLALFVCNLFENPSSSEWLLYISEWDVGNTSISNMRVTTKIAANALLSENVDLQNYGTAIIHNLACKEVFDDVAVELTMAVLQFFNSKPEEERLYRCMKALAKFIQVSQQDVSQLIQMIGPQPAQFKGTSQRVDELISRIEAKLR